MVLRYNHNHSTEKVLISKDGIAAKNFTDADFYIKPCDQKKSFKII